MRSAAFGLGLALLAAVPASAQYNQAPKEPRECRRITNQMERYADDIGRARERGNELWEASLVQHVNKLQERRVARCPQYAKDNSAAIFWNKVITVAAKAAWKYFTWQY